MQYSFTSMISIIRAPYRSISDQCSCESLNTAIPLASVAIGAVAHRWDAEALGDLDTATILARVL